MSTAPASFGRRLQEETAARGRLVAGIDPHAALLRDWGLTDDAAGLREFSLRTLDAVAGRVCAVKPQSAFFERHGSAGVAVLEELLARARERATEVGVVPIGPGGGATLTLEIPIGTRASLPLPVRAGDVVLQREASG